MAKLLTVILTILLVSCGNNGHQQNSHSSPLLNDSNSSNLVHGTFLGMPWAMGSGEAKLKKGSPQENIPDQYSITIWDSVNALPCQKLSGSENARSLFFFMDHIAGEQELSHMEGGTPVGKFFFEYWEPILKLKLKLASHATGEVTKVTADFVEGTLKAESGSEFSVAGPFKVQICP